METSQNYKKSSRMIDKIVLGIGVVVIAGGAISQNSITVILGAICLAVGIIKLIK